MQAFKADVYNALIREANDRGITIQELIRAVIVPDWFKRNKLNAPDSILFPTQTVKVK